MKWPHLLWFGLLCCQADYNHHSQGQDRQQDGEVKVMDVFQHRGPVVLLKAQGRRVNEVQHHADASHKQADRQAPERTLRERRDEDEHCHTFHHLRPSTWPNTGNLQDPKLYWIVWSFICNVKL